MNNNLKIVISAIVIIAVATVALFVFNLRKEGAEEAGSEEVRLREKAITELDPEKMSRITLFNNGQDRLSLAIPEWWEGKYRISELGGEVSFSYIDSEGFGTNLFLIKKYLPNDWDVQKLSSENTEKMIMEKQGYIYTYYLSSSNEKIHSSDNEYGQMRAEIELVIKTLK